MKKFLIVCFGLSFFISLGVSGQKMSLAKSDITPYAEVLYGAGVCGVSNAFSYSGGIDKPFGKHWSLGADIHYWKTDYEVYCCDVYSVGSYRSIIPSVKIKFDPGKRNKGVFIGAGLGYVFAKDRGTEQPYTYDPVSGKSIVSPVIKDGNWDYNSIAPSFSWGIGFKIKRIPLAVVNTNYFGNTPWGWGPIATGIGLRTGFKKVEGGCKTNKSNKTKKKCGGSDPKPAIRRCS